MTRTFGYISDKTRYTRKTRVTSRSPVQPAYREKERETREER